MVVFTEHGTPIIFNDDEEQQEYGANIYSASILFPIAGGVNFDITETNELWTSYI